MVDRLTVPDNFEVLRDCWSASAKAASKVVSRCACPRSPKKMSRTRPLVRCT